MAPREPFPGIGNLLPGTNLVVLGTRSGLPPQEPSTAKQLQSRARRALEEVLPRVELLARGELLEQQVTALGQVVLCEPSHTNQLKAAALLGKWGQVEVPEEAKGGNLTVHVHGGVSLGAPAAPPAAIVEGLGQIEEAE